MFRREDLIADLESLYVKINAAGRTAIQNGREQIDPYLNQLEKDRRLGLTLLIAVKGSAAEGFRVITENIRKIEPDQYYYPVADLHLTVIDLISAAECFQPDAAVSAGYLSVVKDAVRGLKPFDIRFKGIIVSDAAILAKGHYQDDELLHLRRQIRTLAAVRGLELKERYQSISAHSTVVRFRTSLRDRAQLLAAVAQHAQDDIGILHVKELDLVIHDWYNRKRENVGKFVF